jgi:hypothetical protein
MKKSNIGLFTLLLVCNFSIQAGVIDTLTAPDGPGLQLQHFESLGQNFIAEDENINIEVEYAIMNTGYPSGDDWIMSLYDGSNATGTLLGSQSLTHLSTWANGDFLYYGFSHIGLGIGGSYSFALRTSGTSPIGGLRIVSGDSYVGSVGFAGASWFDGFDLSFRISPAVASGAVAEPSILALMGLGLAGIGFAVGRKGQS